MAQLALFPEQSAGPAGLRYQPEFASEISESELISRISELPLQPFQFGAFEGRRRVASFGFRYDYTLKRIQAADPIPAWLTSIARSVGLPGRQVCSPSRNGHRQPDEPSPKGAKADLARRICPKETAFLMGILPPYPRSMLTVPELTRSTNIKLNQQA